MSGHHADRASSRRPLTGRIVPASVTRGFLFADLRGYTDFVERRGAAAAADLLARYWAQRDYGRAS